MPDSHTTATADALEDLAASISIERTEGCLTDASRLLSLINVAADLAQQAAKDTRSDGPLALELRREAKALGDLSDRLCDALNDYGERHHPREQIISEIQAAAGALAVAS